MGGEGCRPLFATLNSKMMTFDSSEKDQGSPSTDGKKRSMSRSWAVEG